MGFYSPTWVRTLIKEDAKNLQDYVSKNVRNDFRGYIDATLPFTLWLDIKLIKERTLDPAIPELKYISKIAYGTESNYTLIYNMLLAAYKQVINSYIDNPRYLRINSTELEDKLNKLTTSTTPSKVIAEEFSRTMVILEGNLTSKNKSVMLVYPKFTTVKFGSNFREAVDYSVLGSDNIDEPGRIVRDLLTGKEYSSSTGQGGKSDFFTQLQNIGHVEVDVVSEGDRTVKRGQSSPRLLQALISLPSDSTGRLADRLSRDFSKETGQAETRVQIRKRFKGSKLVFELLVESGMSAGIPESQQSNLLKARKEQAFNIGKGLTAAIRKDPKILLDFETSKSVNQYIYDNFKEILLTGKAAADYTSNFDEISRAPIKIPKIKVKLPSSKGVVPALPISKIPRVLGNNLTSLQALLDRHLQDVISANMGDGTERRVLNYRTGRFAASAKVERLSQSREGMVTAFYSYMKNPYQTFEPGFRQGSPKTRDPKTLISASIREIAATVVGNKLRAVSI